MVISGYIGGLLSALSAIRSEGANGGPPLATVQLARPVIGGIAGLFIYFVESFFVEVKYPILYAVAIAFGFTERAFVGSLSRLAGSAESQIGNNLGLGDKEPENSRKSR